VLRKILDGQRNDNLLCVKLWQIFSGRKSMPSDNDKYELRNNPEIEKRLRKEREAKRKRKLEDLDLEDLKDREELTNDTDGEQRELTGKPTFRK
jgi:hypothetical protein